MFTNATPGGVVAVRAAAERAERARPSLRSWSRVLLTCLAVSACDSATDPIIRGGLDEELLASAEVQILSGNEQQAVVGSLLPEPLVVAALDANGNSIAGAPVTWTFGSGRGGGHGNTARGTTVTLTADAEGLVSVDWELGTRAGDQLAWAEIGTTSTVTEEESGPSAAPPEGRGNQGKGKKVGFRASSVPADAAEVVVSPTSLTLEVSKSDIVTAVVRDQFGNEMSKADVSWATLDPSVATVAEDGTVTAVSTGATAVTASYGELADTSSVSVELAPPVPTEIVVSQTSLTLEVGETVVLTAVVLDQYGNEMPGVDVEWSSSDPSVVSVESTSTPSASSPLSLASLPDDLAPSGEPSCRVSCWKEENPVLRRSDAQLRPYDPPHDRDRPDRVYVRPGSAVHAGRARRARARRRPRPARGGPGQGAGRRPGARLLAAVARRTRGDPVRLPGREERHPRLLPRLLVTLLHSAARGAA